MTHLQIFLSSSPLSTLLGIFTHKYLKYRKCTKDSNKTSSPASFWDFTKEFYARDWTIREWKQIHKRHGGPYLYNENGFSFKDGSYLSASRITFLEQGMLLNPINYIRYLFFLRYLNKVKKKQDSLNKSHITTLTGDATMSINNYTFPTSVSGTVMISNGQNVSWQIVGGGGGSGGSGSTPSQIGVQSGGSGAATSSDSSGLIGIDPGSNGGDQGVITVIEYYK